jgi:hypothetical protein
MTRTTPLRLIILHRSQRRRTDAETFISPVTFYIRHSTTIDKMIAHRSINVVPSGPQAIGNSSARQIIW